MIETMQLFRDHNPDDFVESEREKVEKVITRLQRFVDIKCLYIVDHAISFISTMAKIITYARSQSQLPSTSLTKIKRKVGRLAHASDDRKRIGELATELEDILSLISVSSSYIRHSLTKG